MKLVGTHEEITYILMQCQKRQKCEGCVLEIFCRKGEKKMFLRLTPFQLKALEEGGCTSILISKGDDKDVSGLL